MKIILAFALVSLMALPGCIYYGGGYGRAYYADDRPNYYHRHHHHRHRW